jgi:hypothetical protein
MSDQIGRLKELQEEIGAAYGMWGANELRDAATAAAAVDGFHGRPETLMEIAAALDSADKEIHEAYTDLSAIQQKDFGGVWAGDTHIAANEALKALVVVLSSGIGVYSGLAGRVRTLSGALEGCTKGDQHGADSLRAAAATTAEMTWGIIPDPTSYDGELMRSAHGEAMRGIAGRVDAWTQLRDAGRDFTKFTNMTAANALTARLSDSPLSPLDELVIGDAGSGMGTDEPILSAMSADRASDALAAMNDADRRRMTEMLTLAGSPEHRAYLMKTLGAGHGVDEVARFNSLIAPYGGDPAWLRQHLNPMDSSHKNRETGRTVGTQFQGAEWTQGPAQTCVASSTVGARAHLDPLYALGLTTGGHPGDPAFDNPQAFSERLKDEQHRIYDDGRNWVQEVNEDLTGKGGMTNEQSATVATEELGRATGTHYANVDLDTPEALNTALGPIEKAVDEGYPVPISTYDDDGAHQMMIIGHADGMLHIYNPWGETMWVTEDDFVNGHMDSADSRLPDKMRSVRLPVEAMR